MGTFYTHVLYLKNIFPCTFQDFANVQKPNENGTLLCIKGEGNTEFEMLLCYLE